MKAKITITLQALIIIVLLVALGWAAYQYFLLDQDWAGHVRQLESEHETAVAELEDKAVSIAEIHLAQGYWKAFYNICFGYHQNPVACNEMSRRGYQKNIHLETMPGWNWTYVRNSELQIQ